MASLAVLFGFYAVFCCLQLLGPATKTQASQRGGLAATAFVPAVVIALVLTPLLSFAHVWALGGGAGAGGRRLVAGLARATLLAATVALLAGAVLQLGADGAVVQIGADGHLDRGRGDVARLNIKHLDEDDRTITRVLCSVWSSAQRVRV